LNDVLASATKAKEMVAGACPTESVETSPVQSAVMEKRVAGLPDTSKTIRPGGISIVPCGAILDLCQHHCPRIVELLKLLPDGEARVGID
jgi:hypothetical protein